MRLQVLQVLQTLTGITVDSPSATAVAPKQLPYLGLNMGIERKVSAARSMPTFTTMITLEIVGRVSATTKEAAQDALEALGYSVEQGVMACVALVQMLQQIAGVTTSTEISGEGSAYNAAFEMSVDCECFEAFDPTQIAPAVYPPLEGVNLHLDTQRPFDANGIYSGTPFPEAIPAAPRTTGFPVIGRAGKGKANRGSHGRHDGSMRRAGRLYT